MQRLMTTTALILGTGTAALAGGPEPMPADVVVAQPATAMPAPVSGDWQGPYAGVQLGYGSGDGSIDFGNFDTDGVIGGFHVGYLWDFGNWVVGPELQYDFADLSVSTTSGSGTFDEVARLKLRGGYDFGRGLLYGSLGLAYANFDGLSGVTDIQLDEPGYVVGFGYDYQLTNTWTIGAEYQYHMFDDFGAPGNDVDFGTVHVRASYNF